MGLIKTVAPSPDRRLVCGREGAIAERGREGGAVVDSHGSSPSLRPSVSRRDSPPFIVQCIEASNRADERTRERETRGMEGKGGKGRG